MRKKKLKEKAINGIKSILYFYLEIRNRESRKMSYVKRYCIFQSWIAMLKRQGPSQSDFSCERCTCI